MNVLLAYIPAINGPYYELIRDSSYGEIWIPGDEITINIPGIRKDVRALGSNASLQVVGVISRKTTRLATDDNLAELFKSDSTIFMPNDDLTDYILHTYEHEPDRIRKINTFLRWHRDNLSIDTQITPDSFVDISDINPEIIRLLKHEQSNTNDWWRSVAGVLVNDSGDIIRSSNNHYLPTVHTADIDGDVRAQANRGVTIEIANAQHAEASIISQCARNGEITDGSSLYVTTFPCPLCAKLLCESGVKKVYYCEGYAVADASDLFQSFSVSVIKINGYEREVGRASPVTYPES